MADKKHDAGFGDEGDSAEMEAVTNATMAAFPELLSADPADVIARMAGRLRGAGTLDELFDALEGQSSDQLIGKSYEFRSVAWQPYKADRGVIPMAVCDVVDLVTGEATEFVTTGTMIVHFLRQAQVIGALPFRARIEGKKTNSGQTALNLVRA